MPRPFDDSEEEEQDYERPTDAKAAEILNKVYYKEGNFVGRDALLHMLKKQMPSNHPSSRQIQAWLRKQELQQLYAGTRSGGGTDRFRPLKPWQNISMDLIDYSQNAAPNAKKYVLVVIDNFSRYMIVRAMNNKLSTTTARFLEQILDEVHKEFDAHITKIITDDGGEFKGPVITLLEERKIGIQRALGGNPQQNGLVERANGKLKLIIGKTKEVRGGSWSTHLKAATSVYNRQLIRSTKFAPEDAVRLKPSEQQQVKDNVKEAYSFHVVEDDKGNLVKVEEQIKRFNVGDKVRRKLNKGKLDKSSRPNWSYDVFTFTDVIPKRGARAEKYKIDAVGFTDKIFTRNDILLVDVASLEELPDLANPKVHKVTTRQAKQVEQEVTRVLRKREQPKVDIPLPTQAQAKKSAKQPKPTYDVEAYRATRGKGKGTQVLVKWVGYDESENTWELLSNQLRDMGVKKVQQLVDQLGTELKVKKK
jgi:transposase InsO family protein